MFLVYFQLVAQEHIVYTRVLNLGVEMLFVVFSMCKQGHRRFVKLKCE